jgi:hypothetical protein
MQSRYTQVSGTAVSEVRDFSTFRFKRMRRFVEQMRLAPENATQRLENVFTLERSAAIAELETLVADTLSLLEAHMPQVDTAGVAPALGATATALAPGLTEGQYCQD